MTQRHITAQTFDPTTGEPVDMVVDTTDGTFVATGEVDDDIVKIFSGVQDMMNRIDPETGELDTTGMTDEELKLVDRINEAAAMFTAQQAAEQQD